MECSLEEKWGLIANNFNILMNLFVEKKNVNETLGSCLQVGRTSGMEIPHSSIRRR